MSNLFKTLMMGIIVVTFSGCGSLFYETNKALQVESGMTKEEVTTLMGKPTHRSFDDYQEQWEYKSLTNSGREYKVSIITFKKGRVVSMDSFSEPAPAAPNNSNVGVIVGPGPVVIPAKPNRFEQFYNNVKSEPFKDGRFKVLRIGVTNGRFTCAEVAQMMNIFSFDDDKLDVLYIMGPHIYDFENFKVVLKALTFLSSKEKAENYIEGIINKRR